MIQIIELVIGVVLTVTGALSIIIKLSNYILDNKPYTLIVDILIISLGIILLNL